MGSFHLLPIRRGFPWYLFSKLASSQDHPDQRDYNASPCSFQSCGYGSSQCLSTSSDRRPMSGSLWPTWLNLRHSRKLDQLLPPTELFLHSAWGCRAILLSDCMKTSFEKLIIYSYYCN